MDVYWKRIRYEKSYFRFLLYVCYFPHILQGPIERYGRLGERLKQELRFDFKRVSFGIQLILWGFIKKLVLANRLDVFITGIYSRQSELKGFLFLAAMVMDVVYIYADFSGCMDIARGVSQIFGVELDLNFNHPFSSRTIDEFWRRWHMSMGSWFKDYVYFPVSTSKLVKNISRSTKNKLPDHLSKMLVTALPVTVTWVLTGLWHGTGKTYLAWGIYYAFMILMSVAFGEDLHQLAVKAKINTESDSWKLFQMFRTTVIFMFGRVLTRPEGLWKTKLILKSLVKDFNPWVLFDGSLYQYGFSREEMQISLIFIALFGVVSWYQQKGSVREWIARQGIVFRYMIYILAVLAIVIFGVYGPGFSAASFAYMAY
jgi:D-alanyl-lipoteichoic acid acyltransferase DltB (MBOAT superfamily)